MRFDRPPRSFQHGWAGDFSGEVPQGEVQRPAAAIVEVDVGQDPVVPLDGQRVVADEQVFVTFEAEHQVARAEARPGRCQL